MVHISQPEFCQSVQWTGPVKISLSLSLPFSLLPFLPCFAFSISLFVSFFLHRRLSHFASFISFISFISFSLSVSLFVSLFLHLFLLCVFFLCLSLFSLSLSSLSSSLSLFFSLSLFRTLPLSVLLSCLLSLFLHFFLFFSCPLSDFITSSPSLPFHSPVSRFLLRPFLCLYFMFSFIFSIL